MRLDKFLVDCGVGSRSQVKTFLKKKQVTVNGQVETSPKTQIDENQDQITFQGQALTLSVLFQRRRMPVTRQYLIYWMIQHDISRSFLLVVWILILTVSCF